MHYVHECNPHIEETLMMIKQTVVFSILYAKPISYILAAHA